MSIDTNKRHRTQNHLIDDDVSDFRTFPMINSRQARAIFKSHREETNSELSCWILYSFSSLCEFLCIMFLMSVGTN